MPSNFKSTGSMDETRASCTQDILKSWYPSYSETEYGGDYLASGPDYSEMTSGTTEKYHQRKKAGELLPHTFFERYVVKCEPPEGQFHTRTFVDGFLRAERIKKLNTYIADGSGLDWYLDINQMRDIIAEYELDPYVQNAAAKLNDSGHDTLTFLAELHKVRQMFVNLIRKILRLRLPSRKVRASSNSWLEWRYGWRTLLFDLEELNSAIESLQEETRQRVSERSGMSNSWVDTEDYSHILSGSSILLTKEARVSLRGSVNADFETTAFSFQPARTAWELVPWSFVLDWIVSVGKSISAISFLAQASKYVASGGIYYTQKRTIEYTYSYEDSGSTTYFNHIFENYSSTMEIYKRIPQSVPYHPLVRLNIDEFKIIDLVALLYNKFARF